MTPPICRLPGALLDPAAYPHRPAGVELHETHISWVLIAGARVYKVKKPVRFPFLHYGTLGRRRAASRDSVSDAGPEIVTAELAEHPGRVQAPAPPLARLDTTRPVAELLGELAARLDERLWAPTGRARTADASA